MENGRFFRRHGGNLTLRATEIRAFSPFPMNYYNTYAAVWYRLCEVLLTCLYVCVSTTPNGVQELVPPPGE